MICPQKIFFAFLNELHHFEKFQIFLQICEKNAKIRKVVKYKVYKKLVFQKSLQLIHDIWTVNISMKIELWNFCKLFCTHISLSHMGFIVMFLQVFHKKDTKYFYEMICPQNIFFAFLNELQHFEKFQIFLQICKKMQKFAKS